MTTPTQAQIEAGTTVIHKKRGTKYITIGNGQIQCDRPIVDNDLVMIYRDPFDGHYWIRPIAEFNDGRFRVVDAAIAQVEEQTEIERLTAENKALRAEVEDYRNDIDRACEGNV